MSSLAVFLMRPQAEAQIGAVLVKPSFSERFEGPTYFVLYVSNISLTYAERIVFRLNR